MRVLPLILFLAACNDVSVGVQSNPPEASITLPAEGATFSEYESVTFAATVNDAQSSSDELVVVWSAGELGELAGTTVWDVDQARLVVEGGFPAGNWTVILKATDEAGESAQDEVNIVVVQNDPPVMALLSPPPGATYAEGEIINVQAFVSDADALSNEELALTWAGSAMGATVAPAFPDANGFANFQLAPLAVGTHDISVTVTDSAGDISTASVEFDVVDDDADEDGFGRDQDCDDGDALVNPAAQEICNEIDDDCDDQVDESAVDPSTWYLDADGDGHGDATATSQGCAAPDGYVAVGDDCDDSDAAFFPGADESDCSDPNDYNCDGSNGYMDADGDAFAACEDCNDADPTISPAATEYCDGTDNDCDLDIDGESAVDAPSWYFDNDADGYGVGFPAVQCDAPAGTASADGDCDDSDAAYNPGAMEEACVDAEDFNCDGALPRADFDGDGQVCDCDESDPTIHALATEACDGSDNDCDGETDESGATGESMFYADSDGDGYGADGVVMEGCAPAAGYVSLVGDCDDADTRFNPGIVESDCTDPTDYNCDGSTGYVDGDGDGFAACLECNDDDASVSPAGVEACGGGDENCDGDVDEAGAIGETAFYLDGDGDGFGDASVAVFGCAAPLGYVPDATDCDDSLAAVNPTAVESCATTFDDNCDGSVNDPGADSCTVFYADFDGDGFGRAASACTCEGSGVYVAVVGGDCDDGNGAINPDGTEVCDGADADEDCDGVSEDGDASVTGTYAYYEDLDADGYGSDVVANACDLPGGYAVLDGDCDDGDDGVNPGMVEVDCADPTDYNCDGVTGFADEDGDLFAACEDCNDLDSGVNPLAEEVCGGGDENCDGEVDEGTAADADLWYLDGDSDGYGAGLGVLGCELSAGYAAVDGDCLESAAEVNPGADEVCDDADVDEDCSGAADDSLALVSSMMTYYFDGDLDGYGGATTMAACSMPSGYFAAYEDCDDGDSAVHPGVVDTLDGVDSDCDGEDAECGNLTLLVPGHYATIQEAIDAACDGDTVDVAAGTYVENIVIDHDVTVQGAGAEYTTIDGGYNGTSVVTMSAGTLSGVTVTNGLATHGGGIRMNGGRLEGLVVRATEASSQGGGIRADGDVAISDVAVYSCTAYTGGGMTHSTGTLDATGVIFSGNSAAAYGGAFYFGGSTLDIYSMVAIDNVENNCCGGGGGGRIDYSQGSISALELSGNHTDGEGLALMLIHNEELSISDVLASDNSGSRGSAVYVNSANSDSPFLQLADWTLARNSGSGFEIHSAVVRAAGIAVFDNGGHGLHIQTSNSYNTLDVAVEGCLLSDNGGSGVYGSSAGTDSLSVTNCVVSKNAGDAVEFNANPFEYAVFEHNDLEANVGGFSGMPDPTGTNGNISVEPEFMLYSPDIDSDRWDLHLCPGSPLIDAGDPSILDPDGSRSDIGAYGGPNADFSYYEDNDGDGMYDGWEESLGLDSALDDGAADLDSDGLTNADEFALCIDASDSDSDDDGLTDGDEVLDFGGDPLEGDSDGDGIPDGMECMLYADSDGDGYGDSAVVTSDCTAANYVSDATDCDDADAAVNPAAEEVCNNGVDDDCDGGAVGCSLAGGSLGSADAKYIGERADDGAGRSASAAGDFNGDGFFDILIGADGNDDGGNLTGSAYLLLGSAAPGSRVLASADAQFTGAAPQGFAGHSVAAAGDFNADGFDDVLVGSPYTSSGSGSAGVAYLILGSQSASSRSLTSANAQYSGEANPNGAGYSLDSAGDANGDGFEDILVGAIFNSDGGTYAGAAYLVLGTSSPTSYSLGSARAQYTGESSGDNAGSSVAGVGDFNGDGLDDQILGAQYNNDGGSDSGSAYLVLGSAVSGSMSLSSAEQFTGEAAGDNAGRSVGGAGDVNGDGFDDAVIGAPYNDDAGNSAGAGYLILGSGSPASGPLSSANAQYSGEAASDYAGTSVSGAGDVDGDGFADMLVGAPQSDHGGTEAGTTYMIFGRTGVVGSSLSGAAAKYYGQNSRDYSGNAVAGVGDVNADGRDDLLVGAYGDDSTDSLSGAAYLILGGGI